VIVSTCEAAGARLVEAHDGVEVGSKTVDGRTSIKLTTARAEYGWVQLGLRGAHQIANALVAVHLLEELARDRPIGPRAIIAGLRDVRWPGRLQLLATPSGKRVLLDAAHNPAGASALAAYLKREFPEPIPFVFGAMRDKDATEMLRILLPVSSAFVLTEPANSRARPADELASIVASLSSGCRIEIEPKPMAALERAWSYSPVVCAAGSIFLIGDLSEGLGTAVTNL
jgi:dihydrofolate synthase/folylpolyglutamate synthase